MTKVAETLPAAWGLKLTTTGQYVSAALAVPTAQFAELLLTIVKSRLLEPASSTSIVPGVVLALKLKLILFCAGLLVPTVSAPNAAALKATFTGSLVLF